MTRTRFFIDPAKTDEEILEAINSIGESDVSKHDGPGPHRGTGTDQSVHGSGGRGETKDEAWAVESEDHGLTGEDYDEWSEDYDRNNPKEKTAWWDVPGVNHHRLPSMARVWVEQKYNRAVKLSEEVRPLMEEIAEATEGELQGLEFELKEKGSILRKAYTDANETGMRFKDAIDNIRDHIRYTITWEPDENYGTKFQATLEVLEDNGWKTYDDKLKNFFAPGDHYGGINAQFTDGERFFELQFHTPESWEIKQKSHALLDELRSDPPTDRRQEIVLEMHDLWNTDLSYIPPKYEGLGVSSSIIVKGTQIASEQMTQPMYYTFNDGQRDLALFRTTDEAGIERWEDGSWVESAYSIPEIDSSLDFIRVSDKFAIQWQEQGPPEDPDEPDFSAPVEVAKSDEHKNLVFGWASVAFSKDGTQVLDRQGHAIDIEDLEDAAYNFVVRSYGSGDMHQSDGFGELVESMVFTKEKADLMGLPANSAPQGWWIGFRVPPEYHQQVREGKRRMFSIEGTAKLEPFAE